MRISLGTMHERLMLVPNIIEEMNLVLAREQCGSNGVHWCVAPTFVVETAFGVKMVEVFGISFGTPEAEVADFKIGPDCVRG